MKFIDQTSLSIYSNPFSRPSLVFYEELDSFFSVNAQKNVTTECLEPTRRTILKSIGLGSIIVGVHPFHLIGDAHAIGRFEPLKRAAIWLADKVLATAAAAMIAKKIEDAIVGQAPNPKNFHERYQSEEILKVRVNEPTACNTKYFGVDNFVRMDFDRDLNVINDLNVPEIRGIKDERSSCGVLLPTGKREEPNRRTYESFREVVEEKYDLDPDDYTLHYVREFSNGSEDTTGFGAASGGRGHLFLA